MKQRAINVLLFYPNVIGYIRLLLLSVCVHMLLCASASTTVTLAVGMYLLSFLCDELDGRIARYLDQCSTFGAALDMLTDRLATCALLMLSVIQNTHCRDRPDPACSVQAHSAFVCAALDIVSHWAHMHATLVQAHTHKQAGAVSPSRLLRLYYNKRLFMGYCCISVELFLLLHMLLTHTHSPVRSQPELSAVLSSIRSTALPGFVLKQVVHLEQLRTAALSLASL